MKPLTPEQQKRVDDIHRGPITLTPVVSSQIAAIGHDPATNTLAVQFHPRKQRGETVGSVYHYSGFDADKFKAFSQSDSIGGHFYEHIKDRIDLHPFVKVKDGGVHNEQAAA